MGECKRVFFLETFGNTCSTVGYYLLNNKEVTINKLSKELHLTKKEVVKALSLFIHFGIVGFTNLSHTQCKYYVSNTNHLMDIPVYLHYIDKKYGKLAIQVLLEVITQKTVKIQALPQELLPTVNILVTNGILTVVQDSELVKKVKLEGNQKILKFSRDKVKTQILNQLITTHIQKYFTPGLSDIFAAIQSGVSPMHISKIQQMIAGSGNSGIMSVGGGSTRITSTATLTSYLSYLLGYGAITGVHDQYQSNNEYLLHKLKVLTAVEYCEVYLSSAIGTILSILLAKGYIEDKFIQKHTLMDASECKKALFTLLSEGLITTQMIPRTVEILSSKSFHLWCANSSRVFHVVKSRCTERINECYIEIEQCNINKHMLSKGEYNYKTDTLYALLEHLHLFHFIMGA